LGAKDAGSLDIKKRLIQHYGLEINKPELVFPGGHQHGHTLLHDAIHISADEVIFLLQNGADADLKALGIGTPLDACNWEICKAKWGYVYDQSAIEHYEKMKDVIKQFQLKH